MPLSPIIITSSGKTVVAMTSFVPNDTDGSRVGVPATVTGSTGGKERREGKEERDNGEGEEGGEDEESRSGVRCCRRRSARVEELGRGWHNCEFTGKGGRDLGSD